MNKTEQSPSELNDLGEIARDAHSFTQAAELFRKAAEQSLAEAQTNLGALYDTGRGVAQDRTEAAMWYRKAAEGGDVLGQANLARYYYLGRGGLPLDKSEAAKWWRRAAQAGDARSQSSLAELYSFGEGVTKDPVEALKWYLMAAKQADIAPFDPDVLESQYNVGAAYFNGLGVARNIVEAAKWFRAAAARGHANAKSALVICEREGSKPASRPDVNPQETHQIYRDHDGRPYRYERGHRVYCDEKGKPPLQAQAKPAAQPQTQLKTQEKRWWEFWR